MIPFWFANGLLDAILKGEALVVHDPLQLALVTGDLSRDVVSLSGQEPAGGGYARQNVIFGDSVVNDFVASTATVKFPQPTTDWGEIYTLALCAGASGAGGGYTPDPEMDTPTLEAGKVLWIQSICPKKIDNGDPAPSFPAGDVKVCLARCGFSEDCILPFSMSFALADVALGLYLQAVIGANPTPPWLALSKVEVSPFDTAPTEVTGAGYARKALTFGSASGGFSRTSTGVTFGAPTADWGEVKSVRIFDASSGGNLLFSAPICSMIINEGDVPPAFPTGSIIVGLG